MRLLLDTQVMLWWLLNDPRLGPETRDLMAASPCVVSVASIGDFQESCHSLAAIQAAWIKGSARTGSGSSGGLFIHTSAG